MEPYPHGWDVWSHGIRAFMSEKGIEPNRIYTSEEADAPQYLEHLGIETVLIDPKRTFMNISGGQIRENPFRYWEYIPTEVKPFFVRTVAILGGESSGKSTLVNKLANIFNTTSASNMAGIMFFRISAAMRWRSSIRITIKLPLGMRSILILR